jgi:hemerythrin
MALKWSPKLELGIGSIDREHQILVQLINELEVAIREGRGNQVVRRAVEKLQSYTVMHFGREELLFAQHQYANAVEHKAAHKVFVDKVAEFKSGIDHGRIGLGYTVMTFLEQWIERHILGTDRQYVSHLQRNGVH